MGDDPGSEAPVAAPVASSAAPVSSSAAPVASSTAPVAAPSPTYRPAPEYDIELVGCSFAEDNSGVNIGSVTCDFKGLGGDNHDVYSDLLGADCNSDPPVGVTYDGSGSFVDTEIDSFQESFTYKAIITISKSLATSASSVTFCQKTYVDDSTGQLQDWIGQKITLDISLDGNFETAGLTTEEFDGNTGPTDAGNLLFGVEIVRCDEQGETITGQPLAVGDNLFFCIKGDKSNVLITNIQDMRADKTGITTYSIVSLNTVGTEGSNNVNTFIYGKGTNEIVVATRIPIQFYQDNNSITIKGTANLAIGSRRKLGREMQAAAESSDFEMKVEVAASSASAIKAIATVSFGAIAVFVALVV